MHVSPSILSPFSSDSESRRSDSRSAISYLQGLVDRSPREETGSRARSVAPERRKRPTKLSRISRGPLETITTQPAPTNEEQPRLYVHCEEKEAIRSRNFVLARLKIILYRTPRRGRHGAPGSRTLPRAVPATVPIPTGPHQRRQRNSSNGCTERSRAISPCPRAITIGRTSTDSSLVVKDRRYPHVGHCRKCRTQECGSLCYHGALATELLERSLAAVVRGVSEPRTGIFSMWRRGSIGDRRIPRV